MVVLGVDPHKHSHTVVAVDEAGCKLGELTVGWGWRGSFVCWGGRGGWLRSAVGRWRMVGMWPAGWSVGCLGLGSGWCGCHPS
jgi:transposase